MRPGRRRPVKNFLTAPPGAPTLERPVAPRAAGTKETRKMLGFQDAGTALAYFLTIGAALFCVVYGIANWNKPAPEEEKRELAEEAAWEKEDAEGKGGDR